MKQLIPYRLWVYLVVILLLGILPVCYIYYIEPLQEQNRSKELHLQQLEAEVNRLKEQQGEEAESDQQRLIELARSIPVTPTVQQLIRDLEIMQERTNIKVVEVSFQSKESNEAQANWIETLFGQKPELEKQDNIERIGNLELATIQFNIQLEGTRKAILDFVKRYNELPRTVRIDNVYFNGHLSNNLEELAHDQEIITSSIELSAYYIGQFAPYLKNDIPLGKDNALKLEDLYSLEKHLDQLWLASNTLILDVRQDSNERIEGLNGDNRTAEQAREQRLAALVQPKTFHLIQFGSYSNTGILDQIVKQLEAEGYAPRVYSGGLNNLYLAAAADQHTATGLQEWLLAQQKEGYVKQIHYDIDYLQQEELITLLTVGGTLFDLLSQQALALLIHQEQYASQTNFLPDERIELLLHDYQAYYELALAKGVDIQQEQISLLYTSISKANEKLHDYRQSQKAEDILQLQGHLLDYILTVYDLTR